MQKVGSLNTGAVQAQREVSKANLLHSQRTKKRRRTLKSFFYSIISKGTNVQAKMNHLRILKSAKLRRKHSTYTRLAHNYNERFGPNVPLPTPTLKEVEQMDITDRFFDCGHLTHPREPWAVDPRIQEGIEAHLDVLRCDEELRRIAKEARQMMNCGLAFQDKIDCLGAEISQGMNPCPCSCTTTTEG